MRRNWRLSIGMWLSMVGSLTAQGFPRSSEAPIPQTYGGTAVSYVEVPAIAFLPFESTHQYSLASGFTRYSVNCAGLCMGAPLHLPSGAKIVSLEIDYVDSLSTSYVYGSLMECSFLAQNCVPHPAAAAGDADCAFPGYICSGKEAAHGNDLLTADLTPDAVTVNNRLNSYILSAGFGTPEEEEAIAGMIVGYVLQVSAPPAIASFVDVPTDHPYFQFIEAILASGITGGCEQVPLQFCPDRPITRGEMAVFLSKLLGLQFP